MAVKAQKIFDILENLAPLSLAETWDNCGLQIGSCQQDISGVCVSLDIDEALVDWVIRSEANLIVTHHPLFFNSFKNLDFDTDTGNLVRKLVSHGISVYSMHTNLDSAPNGLNQYLAERIGLRDIKPLGSTRIEKLFKLVVFVPHSHVETVRKAINDAGAGFLGQYKDSSFRTEGIGTFRPLEGSHPYLGSTGVLEEVGEFRLETVVPEEMVRRVVEAMIKVHPYEEVAYDVYPLINEGKTFSYGRIGHMERPMALKTLAGYIKKKLDIKGLRFVGDPARSLSRIALVSGAGASMIPAALAEGCDVLITGDLKYHEAREAEKSGLALIDAGHDGLELLMVEQIAEYIETAVEKAKWGISVFRMTADQVFRYI